MYEIDNEKFGVFLAQLRKQKGLTQKELAQELFISDKAISKWERGLCMPDIALLSPLANMLGVTITELLSGQHIGKPEQMNMREVEKLVSGTINLSAREQQQRRQQRKRRGLLYFACVVIACLECILLYSLGYSFDQLTENILLVEALTLLFGGWFCLLVKETLPAYYDENKIHTYSDGVFRINLAGVHFNNSNWPHILRSGRIGLMTVSVVFPLIYLIFSWFFPAAWNSVRLYVTLLACLVFFVPMIVTGKRYE